MDDLTGEVRIAARNLKCKISYFFRRPETADGNLFSEGFQFFFGETPVHFGVDDTAGDGVDGDAAWRKLFCKCTGESIHATLGSGVSYFAGRAAGSPHGGNIDDAAGFFGEH